MYDKEFYRSKTFWFFLLYLVVAVANVFGFGGFQAAPDQVEIAAVIVAVVGLVLRFLTKEPIRL